MRYREVTVDRSFVLTMTRGADWRAQLEGLADREDIRAGWFVALGSVRGAELWYYDQKVGEYQPFAVDYPMEVAACVGNLSILDGEPFAHTHAVLSDPDGRCVAGHLDRAEVFAGEAYVATFDEPLERTHDPESDLDLWDLEDAD